MDDEYRRLLKQKSQIDRELRGRIKANPLKYYWPHSGNCDGELCKKTGNPRVLNPVGEPSYEIKGCPQYEFHTSLASVRALFGSNRSGKTVSNVVEAGFHLFGEYPDWYPKKRRYRRSVKGRMFGGDYAKMIGKVIIPAIEEWWPKGKYTFKRNNQGIPTEYICSGKYGKSVLDILSYEQPSKTCEGWWGDFCIEGTQRVLLSDGRWIQIKNIKVGDTVWTTHDNYLRVKGKVVATHKQGRREVLKIKTRSGYELVCTPDHKIWTVNRGWVEARNLVIGKDSLYSPEFKIPGKKKIASRLMFMLGVWLGDGWFCKSVFVACANKTLLEQIEENVEKISHKSRYDYRIKDKELRDFIIGLGLRGKKSGTKFIPDEIFTESR
ncbi:MAG: hypothetical protein U9R01_02245, partial [candidate division WOR-3 bacterium]|nr:hypothetical protein [candidate division WOR-3 bacterium]